MNPFQEVRAVTMNGGQGARMRQAWAGPMVLRRALRRAAVELAAKVQNCVMVRTTTAMV